MSGKRLARWSFLWVLVQLTGCSSDDQGIVRASPEPDASYPWLAPGYDQTFVESRDDGTEPSFVRWQFLPTSEPSKLAIIYTGQTPVKGWTQLWYLRLNDGVWRNIQAGSQPEVLEEFMPARLTVGYEYVRHESSGPQQYTVLATTQEFSVANRVHVGFVLQSIDGAVVTNAYYDPIEGPLAFERQRMEWNGEGYILNPDAPILRLEVQK
jgi:hypothetical protein